MNNYEQDILKMDFKQLRAKVEELDTILARMKREIESRLTNLDESNFATHINKQRDGMKAEIEITAEKLQSTYTKTEGEFSEFKTQITQTAEEIRTTAEAASTTAAGAVRSATEAVQTAESISTKAEADISQMFARAASGNGAPGSGADKTKLYFDTVSGTYYRYNGLRERWESVDQKSIFSTFTQTADGFRLTGDVIVGGTIEGVNVQTSAGSSGARVALSSTDNALVVMYNGTAVGEVAGSLGAMVIGGSGKKVIATGNIWDFSSVANVVGLTPYLYFS